MARMLGKARSGHDCMWCCPGHDPGIKQGRRPGPKKTGRRGQRAREDHAFRRGLSAQQADERATHLDVLFDEIFGPSDCRHGCNGDCVTSGSDRCDFTCH